MSFKFKFQDNEYSVGDTLKVNYKIKEKDKERIQAFDGILLAIQGHGDGVSIVVQKAATDGVKVERIFPINSPWIDSIKKVRTPKAKIRRSKLYFLRQPRVRKII